MLSCFGNIQTGNVSSESCKNLHLCGIFLFYFLLLNFGPLFSCFIYLFWYFFDTMSSFIFSVSIILWSYHCHCFVLFFFCIAIFCFPGHWIIKDLAVFLTTSDFFYIHLVNSLSAPFPPLHLSSNHLIFIYPISYILPFLLILKILEQF